MTVLKGSERPVFWPTPSSVAPDEANALKNFEYVGYQPPQNGLTSEY